MITPSAAQIAIAKSITTSAVTSEGSSVPLPSSPRAIRPSALMTKSLGAAQRRGHWRCNSP